MSMNIERDIVMIKLQRCIENIRKQALLQAMISNFDIAERFERIANENQNIVFDLASMIIVNPEFSVADVKGYVLKSGLGG